MKHSEQILAKKIQKNSPYLLAGIVGGVVAIFAPFIMMGLIWSIGIAAGMFIYHPRISIIIGILAISTIATRMRASELPSLAWASASTAHHASISRVYLIQHARFCKLQTPVLDNSLSKRGRVTPVCP